MTQQPYGQPAYPQQPYNPPAQQGYPSPQAPYVTGPQGYPQGAPGYPAQPQAYPQQPAYGQPSMGYPQPQYGQQSPAPQGPPPVQGTLDAFNQQPTGGSGPGLSFKDAPLGHTYRGTVARDVRDSDVTQDSDPKTKAPKTFRDGRPQWVMAIPLQLDTVSQAHPDGRATLYVRSGVRDALEAAKAAAGIDGPPKAGDQISLTLVERKNTGQAIPKSIYGATYVRASTGQSGQHYPEAAPQGYGPAQGQPQPQQAPPQPYGQPAYPQPNGGYPAPYQVGDVAPQQAPMPAPTNSANVPAPQAEQAPAQQPAQAVPGLPAGITMTPEQQAYLATLQQGA